MCVSAWQVKHDELPAELEKLRAETDSAAAERDTVEKCALFAFRPAVILCDSLTPSVVLPAVAAKRSEASYAVDELTRGVAFYKRLGLDFDGLGEDLLHLRFTKIDPRDLDREFTFSVKVTEDDVYDIRDVNPPVEGVAEMVEELNETNDFSYFVRRMRREFVAIVAKE